MRTIRTLVLAALVAVLMVDGAALADRAGEYMARRGVFSGYVVVGDAIPDGIGNGDLSVADDLTVAGDATIAGEQTLAGAMSAGSYKLGATTVLSGTTLGSSIVTSSLTAVGALAGGSIASGFGAIDVGADNITTTGSGVFGTVLLGAAHHADPLPTAEAITAAATITANACGGIKRITSATALSTGTTNTFTAPAAANENCVMMVCNANASDAITLDNNALFESSGGADVVLAGKECVAVGSDGAVWRQLAGKVQNHA